MTSSSNTKKVSLNALFLYMRTAFSMIIQLIAVRYLLKYLGEDGYGLYGLIGSIVTVVSSLNGLLSSSVQRYLNIAIGQRREDLVKEIFNSAIRIHLGVFAVLVSITIIAGAVAMPWLEIPDSLRTQAWWVLGFSALTMGVDLLAVPYTAMLMAYEKFNAYAALCILDQTLKLVIVLLLIFFPTSRVAIYSGLLLGTTIIVRVMYVVACRINFRSLVDFCKINQRKYLKELMVFSGFKGIGIMSNALQNTGVNFIINAFGGLIANTARTISYQVLTAVNVLVWNVNFAFNPRIMTLYGEGNMEEYELMVERMTKFTFLINLCLAFSISTLIYPILNFWLGEIPMYTPGFVMLVFLYAIPRSFIDSIDTVFTAEGKVRGVQYILTGGMAIILTFSWVALKLGYSIYWSFGLMAIFEVAICVASYALAARITQFNVKSLVKKVAVPACLLLISFGAIGLALQYILPQKMNPLLLAGAFIVLLSVCGIVSMKVILSRNEFSSITNMMRSIIAKLHH